MRWSSSDADLRRRVLELERRLDLQGTRPRPQTQRFDREPCCAVNPAPLLITAGPGNIVVGANATYDFLFTATSSTIHMEGDVPIDDGRGFGARFEVTGPGAVLVATIDLTGPGATFDDDFVVSFSPGDQLVITLVEGSAGDFLNVVAVVTLDGTVEEEIPWANPS